MVASPNFEFLKRHDPQLVRLGSLAERYFADDPNTCLLKLRQFGEILAQLTAANVGLYTDAEETQVALLHRLRDRGVLKGETDRLFHELRKAGNEANHGLSGNVIYLTPTQSEQVYQTVFELPGTRHKFEVIRLWEVPVAEFLSSPGLLPLAILRRFLLKKIPEFRVSTSLNALDLRAERSRSPGHG